MNCSSFTEPVNLGLHVAENAKLLEPLGKFKKGPSWHVISLLFK